MKNYHDFLKTMVQAFGRFVLLIACALPASQAVHGQELEIAAERLFVPGGGKTGQQGCDGQAKMYPALSEFHGGFRYFANYPFNPDLPMNPEGGTCYSVRFNTGPILHQMFNGGRCEKGWVMQAKYGIGGAEAVDPTLPWGIESNPLYYYAAYDLTCKRTGLDAAKNAGAPSCEKCTKFPIHIGTGNKYLREHDYQATQYLSFSRHYNNAGDSLASRSRGLQLEGSGYLGNRWRGTYFRTLSVSETQLSAVSSVRAVRDDGRTVYFTKTTGQAGWNGEADEQDALTELNDATGTRAGWRYYAAGLEETEVYDVGGKLLSITTRSGLTQTLVYSDGSSGAGKFILDENGVPTTTALPAGLLLRVTDAFGHQLQFGYDAANHVVAVTDPAGSVIRYAYDSGTDNLVSVTYPGNKVRQYLYNEQAYTSGASLPNALTGIIDENGIRFVTYMYDAEGRAVEEIFPAVSGNVNHYTLAFDPSGLRTIVTDPLGAVRIYDFTNKFGVTKLTNQSQPGASGSSATSKAMTYDVKGNIASQTDFNGNVTQYSYDLSRNLETSRVEGAGTAQARTITTQWHPALRLPARIAEPLRISALTYDASGNLLDRTVQATTDASGAQGLAATPTGTARRWTYTYNNAGQVLTSRGPRTDVADLTTYAYDGQGNLASVTNALGHVTTLSNHDAHGHVGRITDPNGATTDMTYSPRGWLSSRTVTGAGIVETTTYAYDGVGQMTQVTLPDGSAISYTYDDAHRLTAITDSLGNRIAYTLDAMGNRLNEQARDPDGQLRRQTSRVYDALNRLQQLTGSL